MNKFITTAIVTGTLIISSISVYAGASCGGAGPTGCSASKQASCANSGASGCSHEGGASCAGGSASCHKAAQTASPEAIASFNKESLDLQKQLIDKFGEYKKESLEATPNPDRLAQIKRDMLTLQASVQKIADKYGIPAPGCAGGSGGGCRK
jgi:basic membrane lipoprotein Med (substrate-binding protein (PBP1-ABC) superfamily)